MRALFVICTAVVMSVTACDCNRARIQVRLDGGDMTTQDAAVFIDAGTCTPQVPCSTNPGGACLHGVVACTGLTAMCVDGAPLDAGVDCGNNAVCNGLGVCVGCVKDLPCQNGSASCREGTTTCDTGAQLCVETQNRDAGASCGTNAVCDGLGGCIACTKDQLCQSGPTSCREGLTTCDTGAQLCLETRNRDAGSSCGTNAVCDGLGSCGACTTAAPCSTNPTPCVRGMTSCATGSPACLDSLIAVDAGTPCGTNALCDGAGHCNACTPNLPCVLNSNVCVEGRTACVNGISSCTNSAVPLDAGVSCDIDKVCDGDGGCMGCVVNASCGSNTNSNCAAGALVCGSTGPVCVDSTPRPDRTLCTGTKPNQVCLSGVCSACTSNAQCPTGLNCASGACVLPTSTCATLKAAYPSAATGVFWIDSDGLDAGRDPFQVHCEMSLADGGWTLITALTTGYDTQEVGNTTLITPASPNQTNRDMRLPGVTEILIVQDGNDVGFETSFDKAELITGVTGHPLTWAQILAALNTKAPFTWDTTSDTAWRFTISRINTTGCLQTPFSETYGDGDHGSFNVDGGASLANSTGTLWWHWGGQRWVAGTAVFNPRGAGGWLMCNTTQREFALFSNTVYLR